MRKDHLLQIGLCKNDKRISADQLHFTDLERLFNHFAKKLNKMRLFFALGIDKPFSLGYVCRASCSK